VTIEQCLDHSLLLTAKRADAKELSHSTMDFFMAWARGHRSDFYAEQTRWSISSRT
jgi:hypothetical protein